MIDYLGEVIGPQEAERLIKLRNERSEANYIMFLREYIHSSAASQSKVNLTIIDARNYSNQARLINHSCEPNLFVLPVRIGHMVPHAALFALRDINEMEELSYDYNGTVGGTHKEKEALQASKEDVLQEEGLHLTKCSCGSTKCRGFLPTNII